METYELTRTQLLANATAELKPIKNKKDLVNKFNTYSGQSQASLPRIAVKLFLEENTPFNETPPTIINNFNQYIGLNANRIKEKEQKKIEDTRQKNEEYAKKVQEIKTKRENDIKRSIIQDRLDERAFRQSKKIDMNADKAIEDLEKIRLRKKTILEKERLRVSRQKTNLDKLKEAKKIDKEFYNSKKKKYTAKNQKLDQLQKKYENSEYNRMEKEKLRINLERKKLKRRLQVEIWSIHEQRII